MRMHVVAAVAILLATSPMAMAEDTPSTQPYPTVGVADFGPMQRLEALSRGEVIVPECRPVEEMMSVPVAIQEELVSFLEPAGQCT